MKTHSAGVRAPTSPREILPKAQEPRLKIPERDYMRLLNLNSVLF